MKPSEAVELFRELRAAFPAQAIDARTPEVYARFLGGLEYADGAAAVERLIASSRFLPTIAEIRDEVARARVGAGMAATEAWAHVLAEVRRVGVYQHVGQAQLTPAMQAGIRALGGWEAFCQSEEPQGVLRAHFTRAYDDAMATAVRKANHATLPEPRRAPELEPGTSGNGNGNGNGLVKRP